MTLCRICDDREATTHMPWTRRPCCEGCLARIVEVISEARLEGPLEYLGLREAMKRHPAKGKKRPLYLVGDLRAPDLRID